MLFETEKFIDTVFDACCISGAEGKEFSGDLIRSQIAPAPSSGEENYYQSKNMNGALNVIEGMRLIAGENKPEFTKNIRLLKEVRHARITAWGKIFKALPAICRWLMFFVYIRKKSALSIMGVLAFLKLSQNAIAGTAILAGWIEYFAVALILYLVFLAIRRLIN